MNVFISYKAVTDKDLCVQSILQPAVSNKCSVMYPSRIEYPSNSSLQFIKCECDLRRWNMAPNRKLYGCLAVIGLFDTFWEETANWA